MGAVDRMDQLLALYSAMRKSTNWYRKWMALWTNGLTHKNDNFDGKDLHTYFEAFFPMDEWSKPTTNHNTAKSGHNTLG